MRFEYRRSITIALAAAALFSQIAAAQQSAQQAPQAAPGRGPGRGPGPQRPPDPRVQQRKYHFDDTNVELPYALFVSSRASKDKPAPLIVALHGLGGDPNSLLRGNAIDLAEEGGYILVGPMGYNPSGWYGSPVITPGRGRGGQGTAPPADPPNLTEMSARDVMNVLDLMRKEFKVDPNRTYLMGHSMGGAGALFLGAKRAENWAAIAAMAPAAFAMLPTATDLLTPIKDSMPVLLTQGDADTVVPPDYARRWAAAMKGLNMNYKYIELPGEDHGTIIAKSMPDIFRFFNEHSKTATH